MQRRRGGYAPALEQTADLRKLCRCAYKLAALLLILTLLLLRLVGPFEWRSGHRAGPRSEG
jgi:hypothetical protein